MTAEKEETTGVEAGDTRFKLLRHLSDIPDWKSYSEDEELFIQGFPKVELHVHLDGSFDPDFLWAYLQKDQDMLACLPVATELPWDPVALKVRELVEKCKTSREFHGLCTCRGYRSLKAMLTCFEIFLPLVRNQYDLIEELAYDFCKRQWEQNVIYTEVRYSPFLLAEPIKKDDDFEDADEKAAAVFAAITKGLRRGSVKYGITVNQIISAITWRPDWAPKTLDLVVKHQQDFPCATVGIDVAAGEEHFDKESFPDMHQPHYDMIQRARELNIPITIHAGEVPPTGPQSNLQVAIDEYGASRIGHGYRVIDDIDMIKKVKDKKVHLEVCPTSSNETGGWMYTGEKNWKEHPMVGMVNAGLSLSINSDDPGVFHTSLAWQYRVVLAKMGLTHETILQANLDGIEAAFCPSEEKEKLKQTVNDFVMKIGMHKETTDRQWHRAVSENFVDRVYVGKDDKTLYV
jgi:adenosine deaminase